MDFLNFFLIFTKLCILLENKEKKFGVRGTLKSSFLDHLCAAHSITPMTSQRSNYVLKVRTDKINKLN